MTPIVYFAAYRKGGDHPKRGETITYNTVISNKGNGLSSESGIFKSPIPGFYFFTFAGETAMEKKVNRIDVYYNSVRSIDIGETNDNATYGTLSASWQFKLVKHDTVKIKVRSGMLYANVFSPFFTEYLIEETT